MKVYILNLAKDVDRRQHMELQLSKAGISDYEFVEAVDGRKLDMNSDACAFNQKKYALRAWEKASPGEVGCALSHYSIWEKVAKNDISAIILEDDVELANSSVEFLENLIKCVDNDEPAIANSCTFCVYRKSENIGTYRVVYNPIKSAGTHCYAMNSKAAQLLLSMGKPHYLADDWGYFCHKGLYYLCFLERYVRQSQDFKSNIEYRSSDFVKLGKVGKIIAFLRIAWRVLPYKFKIFKFWAQ